MNVLYKTVELRPWRCIPHYYLLQNCITTLTTAELHPRRTTIALAHRQVPDWDELQFKRPHAQLARSASRILSIVKRHE